MKIFQKILMVVFVFFILIGILAFSTYKSKKAMEGKIVVNVWGVVNEQTFNNFLLRLQEESNEKLNIKYFEKDIKTIDNEIIEAIAVGKSPDIVLLPQQFIKRYSDKVYYTDFKTLTERKFRDTYIEEAELYINKNGIFGTPFYVDPLIMYWNKDIFSSAGVALPPSEWSEIPLLVKKITKVDGNSNIKISLLSFGEYKNLDNAKDVVSMLLMQSGNNIVNLKENNKYESVISDENVSGNLTSQTAVDFFVEYSNPKKIVYSWNRSLPYSKQMFLGENLAIYFGFSSEYPEIKEKNPNLIFDIAIVPQVLNTKNKITFGNIYGFAIIKSSKKIAYAQKAISYMANENAVKLFSELYSVAPVFKKTVSYSSNNPIFDIFYKSAIISKGWIDPDMFKTDLLFKKMIEDITIGKTSSEQSIIELDIELDKLL